MSKTYRRHEAMPPSGATAFCRAAAKVILPSKTDAKRKIRWQRSQPDCYDGHLLQAYRCGTHWHIGHRRAA